MKTAIYIEDGTVQLVITPETKFEKKALTTIKDKVLDAKIFAGTFYDCRGGWVRQTHTYYPYERSLEDNESLIIRVSEKGNDEA